MHERHHLIWLTEAGWQRQLAQAVDARQRETMAHWQDSRWPLVVRRADSDAAADEICAGIALPPDAQGNKPRIAVRVKAAEVAAARAPFPLRDIVATRLPQLPPGWPSAMADLQEQMARAGITLAVFGSLAWQAVTGQTYLRSTSDIDLLFQPTDRAQLEQGVRLLAYHAMFLPLDGEIVFPGGAAVSWKEWRQVAVLGGNADGRVLVKGPAAVLLERVGALAASLPAEGEGRCAA
ncbi:malonate decarboxylase holo-[acyl-carrier-protein] synthase [Herbaspirillum sp. LeCh32-8]|uniref:malonate decarboxylase holo-[acyl-carrier-protein] synthase n=1 Tax=Herbaspirillum sp. LeCh32-8 TaxID=2821356 RepID=UPI001AEAEC5B|nr:malonate decarboxylase holo-[acyl-carrier-protein] synthase [Herbaspirillum sp. LeCh32-8]MBP0599459.1 malonate decarboxylase holo-[acyl-carrier-protein] synthase [Herbaspirillum sp. LeCh32-8]